MNHKISNVRFEQIKSEGENFNKVKVSFLLDNKEASYLIYTKKDKNPIREAKKIFESDMVTGKVYKTVNNVHSFKRPFIITATVLGAAVIALGGVLTYKLITSNRSLAKRYLNNPIKITNYINGVLESEQTVKYDNNWYVIGNEVNSYDTDGTTLIATSKMERKLDEKNRAVSAEIIDTDLVRKQIRRSINKNIFETDDKGEEYSANFITSDGEQEQMISSTYDVYENVYTAEGKKTINYGEDKSYQGDVMVFKKIRQSEDFVASNGVDSTSSASAKIFEYDEAGTESLTNELSSTSERKARNKTGWDADFRRLNITKPAGGEEQVDLMIGFETYKEDKSPIYNETRNYSDKEGKVLIAGKKTNCCYDDFNRPVLTTAYSLLVPKTNEEEVWTLSQTDSRSYHGNENSPFFITKTAYNTTGEIKSNYTYSEFDEYGRVIYQETAAYGAKRKPEVKSTKYVYGDPIPYNPERQN